MIAKSIFQYNPVLLSMTITETLNIAFKKGYTKRYYGVPTETSYGLLYSKQPLIYFTEKIKNQYKNERI